MSAWDNQLGSLRVRSLALPRDGGVLNKATAGKYRLDSTDVAKTIKREHARLRAEAAAQQAQPAQPAAAPALIVCAAAPATVAILQQKARK